MGAMVSQMNDLLRCVQATSFVCDPSWRPCYQLNMATKLDITIGQCGRLMRVVLGPLLCSHGLSAQKGPREPLSLEGLTAFQSGCS
jgi:hypothetical protein